ncbi:MAG: tail fiber domain-containing protein [Patescibacteria group bacterium]|nr:tail fiber domain-containing protein [Patescibacteria group bacterium]
MIGSYAYITDINDSQFKIVDISDPNNPKIQGSVTTSDDLGTVRVLGNYAYVTGNFRVLVIDISDKSNPAVVGTSVTLSATNNRQGLYVKGNYAYYMDYQNSQVDILDVSNPTLPTLVKTVGVSGNPIAITGSGDYIYTITQQSTPQRLSVVNVADPANAFFVGYVDLNITGYPVDITTFDNYLYVHTESRLVTIDIKDKENPVYMNQLTIPSMTGSGYKKQNIIATKNYVYSIGNTVFFAVDVSSSTNPFIKAQKTLTGELFSMSVQGNYAYAMNTLRNLQIVDLGGVETHSIQAYSAYLNNVNISGDSQMTGNVTVSGKLTVGTDGIYNQGPLDVFGSASVHGTTTIANLLPHTDSTYDLGSSASYWRSLYADTINTHSLNLTPSGFTELYSENNSSLYGTEVIKVVGNIMYIGIDDNIGSLGVAGQDFQILDVSDPANPKYISGLEFSTGRVFDMEILGNYAYLAGQDMDTTYAANLEFVVVDISDPYNPTVVFGSDLYFGNTYPARTIKVADNYAYLGGWDLGNTNDLRIYNISNPASPGYVGGVNFGGWVYSLELLNDRYLVVGSDDATSFSSEDIILLDISDPGNPTYVDGIDNGTYQVQGLAVRGDKIYAGTAYANPGGDKEFLVIDAASSTNLTVLDGVSLGTKVITDIVLANDYAYVLQEDGYSNVNEISVINITSSTNPTYFNGLDLGATSYPNDLEISGSTLYAAFGNTGSSKELYIYDIGGLNTYTANIGNLWVDEFSISRDGKIGNNLYVKNDIFAENLDITDNANISGNLKVVATSTMASILPNTNNAYDFGADGTSWRNIFTYNASATNLDVANPGNDTVSLVNTTADLGAGRSDAEMYVKGDILFTLGVNSDNLQSFDISSGYPVLLDSLDTAQQEGFSLNVQGDYAYVLSKDGGTTGYFQIIDISDPSNLTSVYTSGANTGMYQSLVVSGNVMYVTDDNNILIYDISNPLAPAYVASFASYGIAVTDLYISNNYLYTTNFDSDNISIFEIMDPKNPTFIATSTVSNQPVAIRVQGSYAYINHQDTTYDFSIVNLSDRVNAIEIATLNTSYSPYDRYSEGSLYIAGGYAYMAGSAGMHVIDISSSTNPMVVVSKARANTRSIIAHDQYIYLTDTAGFITTYYMGGVKTNTLDADLASIGEFYVYGNGYINNKLTIDGTLAVGNGGITTNGNLNVTATSTFADLQTTGRVNSNWNPYIDDTYYLGNSTYRWKGLYAVSVTTTNLNVNGVNLNDAFVQNGNSFGEAAVLGTNDAFSLTFETEGTPKLVLDTTGNLYPNTNDSYDLGSASNSWNNLYVSSTAYFGGIGGTSINFATSAVMTATPGDYPAFTFYPTAKADSLFFVGDDSLNTALLIKNATHTAIAGDWLQDFALTVGGNVGPYLDNTYDLGNATYRWRNLYGVNATFTNLYVSNDSNTNAFIQNGNSFGSAAVLGTNDAFNLTFETEGTTKLILNTAGNLYPNTNNSYDLGISTNAWRNAYFASSVNIGYQGSSNVRFPKVGYFTASPDYNASGIDGIGFAFVVTSTMGSNNSLFAFTDKDYNVAFFAKNATHTAIAGDWLQDFALTVGGNVGPYTNLAHDLGSSSNRWNNIWGATVHVGTSTWDISQLADGSFSLKNSTDSYIDITTLATNNIGIGYLANHSITTGASNIAIGADASYVLESGSRNTAVGHQAFSSFIGGNNNTALGADALYGSGSDQTAFSNTAIGSYSMYNTDSGSYNSALGMSSLYGLTDGIGNVALGFESGYSLNTGSNNVALGTQSLLFNQTGKFNVAIGNEAMWGASGNSNSYNTAIGASSLRLITTGASNTAVGFESLYSNTTGNYNTAQGMWSLRANTSGIFNAAYGAASLYNNQTGNYNTAIGGSNIVWNTNGLYNTALGFESMNGDEGDSGWSYNTGIGARSLYGLTTGASNTAVGFESLYSNTTGFSNTAVGLDALHDNLGGYQNVAIGTGSLDEVTNGINNNAIGNAALGSLTSGDYNTVLGGLAGYRLDTGSYNVGVGYRSLSANTIGGTYEFNYNSAIGAYALGKLTTGASNTAVGFESLFSLTTGSDNVAMGTGSMKSATFGSWNVVIGKGALSSYTNPYAITAIGYMALASSTSGNQTAIGNNALRYNTTGDYNTAVGTYAMQDNTTGDINNAFGYYALNNNTTGEGNSAFGTRALFNNATGTYNTALGSYALYSDDGNIGNTAVGYGAAQDFEDGDGNVFLGYNAARYTVTGSSSTYIGYRSGGSSIFTFNNAMALGYYAQVTASDMIRLGNSSVSVIEGQVDFTFSSDARLKENITDNDLGLEFLKQLRPRRFELIDDKRNTVRDGFIAQEVMQVMDDMNITFSGVEKSSYDATSGTAMLGMSYSPFDPAFINAFKDIDSRLVKLDNGIIIDPNFTALEEPFMQVDQDGNIAYKGASITSQGIATSSTQAFDSYTFSFMGSAWNSSTTQEITTSFDVYNNTIHASSSELKFVFTSSTGFSQDLLTITNAGDVHVSGDLHVGRRLYLGSKSTGESSTSTYIFVDDTLAPTSTYIATNADGWQTETTYDYAERYESTQELVPGDLVTADPSGVNLVKRATSPSEPLLGIVSTKPGFVTGRHYDGWHPVALAGRVPTRVSTMNGAIKAGDYIAASDIPGVGIKATGAGNVVGVALEAYDSAEEGLISVFVKPSFSMGSISTSGDSAGTIINQTIQTTVPDVEIEGLALIQSGATEVHISYGTILHYSMVYATPHASIDGSWWVANRTDTGFDIILSHPQTHDTEFTWMTKPMKPGTIRFVSDNTYQGVDDLTGQPIGPTLDELITTSTDIGITTSTDSGTTTSTDPVVPDPEPATSSTTMVSSTDTTEMDVTASSTWPVTGGDVATSTTQNGV